MHRLMKKSCILGHPNVQCTYWVRRVRFSFLYLEHSRLRVHWRRWSRLLLNNFIPSTPDSGGLQGGGGGISLPCICPVDYR